MSRKKRMIIVLTLLVSLISVLVYSSSQSYSSQDIRPYLDSLSLEWLIPIVGEIEFTYGEQHVSVNNYGISGFVEFFVRKGAHLVLFAGMGFLLYSFFFFFKNKRRFSFLISLFLIILIATVDEARQLLNPDRTGSYQDVILDSVGGLLGISFALILWKKHKKITKRDEWSLNESEGRRYRRRLSS
ncbi:hypothetical protein BTS2_1906 [Bacillus sp. TS-2]|nr:hypothetical protein BTS2_1906 [Bacillus sp. TS-2]